MANLAEILDGFEKTLELEKELGTRTVECDRALLAPRMDFGLRTSDFRPTAVTPIPPVVRRPPPAVQRPASAVQRPASAVQRPTSEVQSPKSKVQIFFVSDSAAVYAGGAGALFDKMLAAMKLTRSDVALGATDVGRDALVDWIRNARPKCVVVFGREATRALFPAKRLTIGMSADLGGVPAFVTFSPAHVVKLQSGGSPAVKERREIWETLKHALAVAARS